jgi:hypothetical protein
VQCGLRAAMGGMEGSRFCPENEGAFGGARDLGRARGRAVRPAAVGGMEGSRELLPWGLGRARGRARLARGLVRASLAVLLSLSSVATQPVVLGGAYKFALLAKAQIDDNGGTGSNVVALSAIAYVGSLTYVALGTMTTDSSGEFSTTPQVTGKAYDGTHVGPTPAMLVNVMSDVDAAYADAASRTCSGSAYLNVAGGVLGGQAFTAGTYRWVAHVTVGSEISLLGSETDLFIFQVRPQLHIVPPAPRSPTFASLTRLRLAHPAPPPLLHYR